MEVVSGSGELMIFHSEIREINHRFDAFPDPLVETRSSHLTLIRTIISLPPQSLIPTPVCPLCSPLTVTECSAVAVWSRDVLK